MKIQRFAAILLCMAMLLCCFAACDDNPAETTTDNNQEPAKKPTTAKEYIAAGWEKMRTEHYKETEIKETSTTIPGMENYFDPETTVYICQGEYFYLEDSDGISIYLDDVFYLSSPESGIKNKYTVPESGRDDPLLHPKGEDAAWYQSIVFKTMTLGTDANGNVTVMCKGTGEDAKAILEATFGQIPNFAIDYDSLEWTLTLDSDYRFVSMYMKLTGLIPMGSITITQNTTYQYGAEYNVTAPEDADSYKEVDSIMDLYME